MSDILELLTAALADRYVVERELGQGGMATVYLAEDLKHRRKVALKVLRPELAAVLGAERFVQEITTTASLQHPHILPLYDSGRAAAAAAAAGGPGEFLFYVMPYIQGETLREKLDRETQLGIEEAVRITTEVADALDYAHRNGVIHRDIKPENILLHDGRAMVADFGIALAVSAAAGGRMTETGMSLGTPYYMSPEQATAEKDLSARSDVYSLGSVLYEMLTGSPPHVGASAQQIIMKIVTEEAAPVVSVRKSVPPNVAAAVAQALEKLPADRFVSAAEFAGALQNPAFATTAAGTIARRSSGPPARRPAAAVTAVLFAALAAWGWLRPEPAPPVVRYGLALPTTQAAVLGTAYTVPVPAPDGSFLVYHGPLEAERPGVQLWMKRRDSYAAIPIPGTLGAESFGLSPDGEWIAFGAGGQLKKLPIVGGAAVTLLSSGVSGAWGVAWPEDETIVFTRQTGRGTELARVPAVGGEVARVPQPDSVFSVGPMPIHGGHGVLFQACARGGCDVWATDLRGDTARPVVRGARWAQHATTGHLVYWQEGGLMVIPFDADRMEVHGSPVPLLDGVSGDAFPVQLSRSGTLVVRLGGGGASSRSLEMVWVDRTGREILVDSGWTFRLTTNAGNYGWALSPDGSRLAIGLATDAGDDIWVKQLPRGPLSRISYHPAPDFRPRWTPDGRSITFGSSREVAGVYQRRADGTGTDSLLFAGPADEAIWSPDNQWLLMREGAASAAPGGRDITGVRSGPDRTSVPMLVTQFDEEAIAPSPDGRWLAYQSDETGRTEVFVRPFPDTDAGKWQVSNGGGIAPLWSRDGRELFYVRGNNDMMAVRLRAGATLELGEPEMLFHVRDELLIVDASYYTPWDVTADGRFLMARPVGQSAAAVGTVIVAEHWFEELKAKVAR